MSECEMASAVSAAVDGACSPGSAVLGAALAGGAWSAYAARAGMTAHIIMPRSAPGINRLETVMAGADAYLVDYPAELSPLAKGSQPSTRPTSSRWALASRASATAESRRNVGHWSVCSPSLASRPSTSWPDVGSPG